MAVRTRTSAVTEAASVVFDDGVMQRGYPVAKVIMKNMGPNTVFLGPATVTTADGFPLASGEVMTVSPVGNGDVFYGVCVTAETATLRFLFLEQ